MLEVSNLKKYQIVFTEGNTVNNKIIIEAKSKAEAMIIFKDQHPGAIYETIDVIE